MDILWDESEISEKCMLLCEIPEVYSFNTAFVRLEELDIQNYCLWTQYIIEYIIGLQTLNRQSQSSWLEVLHMSI